MGKLLVFGDIRMANPLNMQVKQLLLELLGAFEARCDAVDTLVEITPTVFAAKLVGMDD